VQKASHTQFFQLSLTHTKEMKESSSLAASLEAKFFSISLDMKTEHFQPLLKQRFFFMNFFMEDKPMFSEYIGQTFTHKTDKTAWRCVEQSDTTGWILYRMVRIRGGGGEAEFWANPVYMERLFERI